MNQIGWTYLDEIAPLFPTNRPIQSLCQLIDNLQAHGRKADDLKQQLLERAYNIGDLVQYQHVFNFIEGGF